MAPRSRGCGLSRGAFLLLDVLRTRAAAGDDRAWFTFHDERAEVIDSRSAVELLQRARRIAAALRQAGLERGDRAVLVCLPGLAFVDALIGCLLVGVHAVPVSPPNPSGGEVDSLRRIVEDCKARLLLTDAGYQRARTLGTLRRWAGLKAAPRWPDVPWLVTDSLRDAPWTGELVDGRDDEVAVLQYTSGSTGDPKGVRITWGNIAHQTRSNRAQLGMTAESQLAMWVPQFHDFGLISGILSALSGNGRLAVQSPLTFLKRPASWIDLLHATGATHTAAPNFAYALVTQRTTPEQRARWDLSRLQIVMSAAEPVRHETFSAFAEAFAASRLDPRALCPSYGLAEHTVGVTVGGRLRLRIDPAALGEGALRAGQGPWQVGCGGPAPDVHVRIVDPDTRAPLGPGQVGEIWVDSPSKADGYERRPELSAEIFRARTVPDDGREWLRTGDLGAQIEGELVITGRLKDLVLLRGRNVHPADVEDAARSSHPAIRAGGVAAFGVADASGTEVLALVLELAEVVPPARYDEVARAVRRAIGEALAGVHPDVVVLGRKGLVPKTTSGKVRRSAARQAFEAQGYRERPDVLAVLEDLAPAAPAPEAVVPDLPPPLPPAPPAWDRAALAAIASEIFGQPLAPADYGVPLRALGMSSLQLVTFCATVEERLGRPLPVERLFEAPSIDALCEGPEGGAARGASTSADDAPIAVIGLASRFPGGLDSPQALWQHLRRGAPPVSARLEVRDFDPEAFGLSPREAELMAPEQRLALELSAEVLSHAGFDPRNLAGTRCGVFLGASGVEYGLRTVYGGDPSVWAALGAMPSAIAGRVAYQWGLVGPALVVDTACSSSLMAIHLAVSSLRRGECDYAIVGGINVRLLPDVDLALTAMGAISPTGRCLSFDARADGYQPTDGAGMLLLARDPGARPVWAEIRRTVSNQDGRSNGLSAPNPAQQRALLRAAWPGEERPGWIEAHGSATPLGDAMELQSLAASFPPAQPLPVSSAKGSLGHAEAAAGIAGALRAVLSLAHEELPAQAGSHTPTPRVDLAAAGLSVPTAPQPWAGPRAVGVSAFGLSGTNVHVVFGAPSSAAALRPDISAPAPAVPFQRRRLWIEAGERTVSLEQRTELATGGRVVDRALGTEGWMADHVVSGRPVVPAAAWLSWAAAIAGQEVTGLQITRATPWSTDLRAQAVLDAEGALRGFVRFSDGPWTEAWKARVLEPKKLPAANARELGGAASALDVAEAYAVLRRQGLAYGPAFQRLLTVSVNEGGAEATLSGVPPVPGLALHPALLDAAFQPIPFVLHAQGIEGAWLPSGAERVQVARSPAGALRVEVRGRGATENGLSFDVTLFDEQGLVACVDALTLRPVERAAVEVSRRTWREAPAAATDAGSVRLLGPRAWAEALAEHGVTCGDDAQWVVQVVEPSSPLLDAIEAARATARGLARGARWLVVVSGAGAPEGPLGDGGALLAFLRSLRRELADTTVRLLDLPADVTVAAAARGIALALRTEADELRLDGERLFVPAVTPAPLPVLGRGPYAAQRDSAGLLDGVRLVPRALPTPGPGQVLVCLEAAGLNFRDVLASLGVVPGADHGALGGEGVGHVLALGPDVSSWSVGDRVVGFFTGALATHALADARELVAAPREADAADLATLPIAWATAWRALVDVAGVRAGERVLVHAGTGGVGMAAIQLAQRLGARVFATAHPSKWDTLRALGVEAVASSRDTSFAETFRAAAGGMDVVLDSLAGPLVDAGLALASPGGRFVEIGKRDVRDAEAVRAAWGVRYTAFDLAELGPEGRGALLRTALAASPAPLPRQVFPLARAADALRFMAEAKHRGKLVLRPPAPRGGAALLTGGLGALGQHTARWLLESGRVERVVLVGRTADASRLDAALSAAHAEGRIVLFPADAADAEAIAKAVALAGPELRWVGHAAGVLDDAPAMRQSLGRMEQVQRPKLVGAEVLDRATRHLPSAAFVLFGSAAAWHGPAGQAAYAAMNAGLERVARARRLAGAHALVVAFGPWAGGGMAAGEAASRAFARLGVSLLQPRHGTLLLGDAVDAGVESIAIIARAAAPEGAVRVAPATGATAGDTLALTRAAVARVLARDPLTLDVDAALGDLGLDSLGAIELSNELRRHTGRELGQADLKFTLTTRGLAARLSAQE